jgi:hypothetical protein
MCCFNKVNLSAILLIHKCIINKDCTVKNNNEVKANLKQFKHKCKNLYIILYWTCILAVSGNDVTNNFCTLSLDCKRKKMLHANWYGLQRWAEFRVPTPFLFFFGVSKGLTASIFRITEDGDSMFSPPKCMNKPSTLYGVKKSKSKKIKSYRLGYWKFCEESSWVSKICFETDENSNDYQESVKLVAQNR